MVMICALLIVGLLSIGAITAGDISNSNIDVQPIGNGDASHFVELSNDKSLDLSIGDNSNILLKESNLLIAGNRDLNLSENITGDLKNNTFVVNTNESNEDSKLTMNLSKNIEVSEDCSPSSNQLISVNDLSDLITTNVKLNTLNNVNIYENSLVNGTLIIPRNYSDQEGKIITVEVILSNITDATFKLNENNSITLYLETPDNPFAVKKLSEGIYNASDKGYHYFFEVDCAKYFGEYNSASLFSIIYSNTTMLLMSNSETYIEFTKIYPSIESQTIVGNYSEVKTLVFNVTDGQVGDTVVLHLIDGSNITTQVVNNAGELKAIFEDVTLTNSIVGDTLYNTDLIYLGTGKYRNSVTDVLWNISKITTDITFNPIFVADKVNEIITVEVMVKDYYGNYVKQGNITVDNSNPYLKLVVNGTNDTERGSNVYELIDGKVTVYFMYIHNGTYNLTFSYGGGLLTNNTDNYIPSSNNFTVIINSRGTTVTVINTTAKVEEPKDIIAYIVDNEGKNVTCGNATLVIITSEGQFNKGSVVVVNGTAKFSNVSMNTSGNYTAVVTYSDNSGVYDSTMGQGYFNVTENATEIVVTNVTGQVGTTITVNITVNNVTKAKQEGIFINVTDSNGNTIDSCYIDVNELGKAQYSHVFDVNGTYTVYAKYVGMDRIYLPSNTTGTVIVGKNATHVIVENVSAHVDEIKPFNVTVLNDDGSPVIEGNVTVEIDDIIIGTFEVKDGVAVIKNASYPTEGNHQVIATYSGSEGKYLPNTGYGRFNVTMNETSVNIKVNGTQVGSEITIDIFVDGVHKEGTTAEVTIKDANNITIGTPNVVDIDANGTAQLTKVFDVNGTYTVYVEYRGLSEVYYPSNASKEFTIYRNNTKVIVEDVNTHVDEVTTFNVTVIDINTNKTVTDGAVNVSVNGEFIDTFELTNGVAYITTSKSLAGNYTIEAKYFNSTGKFADNVGYGWFNVTENSTSVDIEVIGTQVGANITFNITVINVTKEGTVTITIRNSSNDVINTTVVNVDALGKALYTYVFDVNGTYNIEVNYPGIDKVYLPSNANKSFTIYRNNTKVIVENVTEVHVEEVTTFNVTVKDINDNPVTDGFVNVTINEKFIGTFEVHDGVAIINTGSYPTAGNHTITAIYFGSKGKFDDSVGTGYFNVIENSTSVVIDITGTQVGANITFDITVNNVTKEGSYVNVTIKDSNNVIIANATLEVAADGTTQFSHVFDKNGTYTVYVDYLGLEKVFLPSNASKEFTINRNQTQVIVENVTEIHVEEVTTFNITVLDIDNNPVTEGFVNVTINNTFIGTFEVNNGVATITNASYSTAGNHTIKAEYYGSEGIFVESTGYGWFNVIENATSIDISFIGTQVGANITIDISVRDVRKDGSKVNVTIKDALNNTIANGIVDVAADGTAQFYHVFDKNGTYTVEVQYSGLEKVYLPSNATESFTIYKNETKVIVENVTEIHVDEVTSFNVTVLDIDNNPVTEGNVTVEIDDIVIGTFEVINGTAVINNASYPYEGDHKVIANYTGSEGKYLPGTGIGHFNVIKNETNVIISVEDGQVGSDVLINITVDGVHKNGSYVNITIKDASNKTVISDILVIPNDGKTNFTYAFDKNGTYTIDVEYKGLDEVYFPSNNSTTVNIFRNNTIVIVENVTTNVEKVTSFNITVKDIYNNPVTEGVVKVTINNTVIGIYNVENGVATITNASYPTAGNHTIKAEYYGSEGKFNESTGYGYFNVIENATSVVIDITGTQVGDNITFNITVNNVTKEGTVTITIRNGSDIVNTTVVNVDALGKAQYSYVFDVNGTYTIEVNYPGIDKVYLPSNATESFTIYRNNTKVIVENVTAHVDEVTSFNVTVKDIYNNPVTDGFVNVTINDKFIGTFEVHDGVAVINNASYPYEGNHLVDVIYFGSQGKFTDGEGLGRFKVIKNVTSIDIDVNGTQVGSEITIDITVNNVTKEGSYVNVTLKDASNDTLYNDTIIIGKDGKAQFSYVFDVNGTYTVYVDYSGLDRVYYPSNASKSFVVLRNDTYIVVENVTKVHVEEIKAFNITVFDINTNKPVTDGFVNVTINDTFIGTFQLINGKATIDNASYPYAGNQTIYVDYFGSIGKFSDNSTTGFFNVVRNRTSVNIDVEDGQVGTNITMNITVDGVHKAGSYVNITIKDGNGNVVNFTQVNVSADGKAQYGYIFDVNGTYTVYVDYNGLERVYVPSSANETFVVYRNNTKVIVDNVDEIHVEEVTTLNVTVIDINTNKPVTDGFVNVSIDEKFIGTFKLIDGKVTITNASYPTAGNHTIYVDYFGSIGKFCDNSTTGYFNVIENATSVAIDVTDGQVGTYRSINITVDGVHKAGSYVNITIKDGNGNVVNFTQVNVDANGKAQYGYVFDVNGTYTVYVDYSGIDKVYLPSSANKTFTVFRNDTRIIVENVTAHVEEVTSFNITVIDINTNKAVTDGFVNVTINDKFIGTFELNNGKVTITNASYEYAGNQTVYVDYFGSIGKFSDNSTTGWFNVLINQTAVTVENVSSHVGEKVDINITVDGVHKAGSELVNITIIDANGTVIDNVLVDIDATGKAYYSLNINKSGIYNVTAEYLGLEKVYTSSIGQGFVNVSMNATTISIENKTTRINETVDIEVTVKDIYGNNVTGGTVIITVNGTNFGPFNVTDGKAVIKDVKVGYAGNFTVTAVYSGYDRVYEPQTSSDGWLNVLKYVPDINVTPKVLDDVIPGSEQNITINITTPLGKVDVDTVNVTLTNGTTIEVPIINDTITIVLPDDIQEGQNITISVPETETSYAGSVNVTIGNVLLVPTYIISLYPEGQDYFEGVYGKFINLSFAVYDCYGKLVKNGTKVVINVLGTDYETTVFENGKVIIPVIVNNTGFNTLDVKYIGNDYYDNCTNTTDVFVNNKTTEMIVIGSVDDVYPNPNNMNVTIIVRTTDGEFVTKGQLSYTLPDGTEHIVEITGESTVLHINVDKTGDYIINVTYVDTPVDTQFAPCNGTFDWHVVPGQTNTTLKVKVVDGIGYYEATVIDEKGNLVNEGNLTFIINGKEVTVNVTNGKALYSEKVKKGVYILNVSATYNANENYNGSSANTTYIIKQNIIIIVKDIKGKPGQKVTVPVYVITKDGKKVDGITVTVKLPNGKVIKVPIVNGLGYFKMIIPKHGYKYHVYITFKGNDYYYPAKASFTVTVKYPCGPSHHGKVPCKEMPKAGNPVLALLLVLLTLPLVRYRKK